MGNLYLTYKELKLHRSRENRKTKDYLYLTYKELKRWNSYGQAQ